MSPGHGQRDRSGHFAGHFSPPPSDERGARIKQQDAAALQRVRGQEAQELHLLLHAKASGVEERL